MELYLKLFEVLFPVFFIVGIGFLLGKKNPNFDTSFITSLAILVLRFRNSPLFGLEKKKKTK